MDGLQNCIKNIQVVFKPKVCPGNPCNACILFITTAQSRQGGSMGCPWKVRLPSHLTVMVPSHRSESCPERSCQRHSLRFHQKFCRVLALAKGRATAKRGENNRLDSVQYGIRTWTQSVSAFNLLQDVHSEANSWRHTIQGAHTGGFFARLIHPSHCKPETASNSTAQTNHEVQLVDVHYVLTNAVSRATSLLFLRALLCK